MACNEAASEVYIQSPTRIDSYQIVRGLTHVSLRGHTDSIVGVGLVSADKEDLYSQYNLLYSAALDNTLRHWDPMTLEFVPCRFPPPSSSSPPPF